MTAAAAAGQLLVAAPARRLLTKAKLSIRSAIKSSRSNGHCSGRLARNCRCALSSAARRLLTRRSPNLAHIDALPHRRRKAIHQVRMKANNLASPMDAHPVTLQLHRELHQMQQNQAKIAGDCSEFRSPHALDLLRHIFDIEVVWKIARGFAELADHCRLLLGPQAKYHHHKASGRSSNFSDRFYLPSVPAPMPRLLYHTSLDCSTAAPMNEANSGCGANGRDLSSGWNCTPTNHG